MMLMRLIQLETPSDPSSAIWWVLGFGLAGILLVLRWIVKREKNGR